MSFETIGLSAELDAAQSVETPVQGTASKAAPGLDLAKIAPPFRRPLRTFMEEARLAAAEGLRSTVAITSDSLTLTLEQQRAEQADLHDGQASGAPGIRAAHPPTAKSWR